MGRVHLSDINYYRLAIWKIYYGVLKVIILGLPSTIMNWGKMTGVEKTIAVSALALSVHAWLDGFIDDTLGRLVAGKPPIKLPGTNGGSDTEIITRTDIIHTTKDTSKQGSYVDTAKGP